ncbi:MAG: ribonuclease HII, partial [Candidatus Odinarchaeia archaeon]
MEKKILGIDEAGRGPVLGPMVVGGAFILESKLNQLNKLKPIDSKKLSVKQRNYFEKELKKMLNGYKLIVVDPIEIDKFVVQHKLNILEAEKMIQLIDFFKPDIVFLDCPQVNTDSFVSYIKSKLSSNPEIIPENYAEHYPIVAAAAILAKTHRDRIIKELAAKYGEIGSGYPSDPKTIA